MLNVDDQVRLLGFQQTPSASCPTTGSTCMRPSLRFFRLSIIEAMAAGLPVIAGEVGGIPELFDPGVEGRFWPLDDPDAAAEILISLMSDEHERKKAGEAARVRFRERYDAEVVAPRFLAFLCPNAAAQHDTSPSEVADSPK